jgi:hypothetical protein
MCVASESKRVENAKEPEVIGKTKTPEIFLSDSLLTSIQRPYYLKPLT